MYSLILSEPAMTELRALEPPTLRRSVSAALSRLTLEPDNPGIAEAIDAEGRVNRIAVLDTVAFVFWTDHALRRVRVLAVVPVGE